MSENRAPDEFIAKRRMRLRVALITAILAAPVICNAANAQVSGMVSPTPTIGATSPLGITTGSTVSPTGIPFGSTEIASPGVSPAPLVTGTVSMSGSGASCSTLGTSPSGMYGSTATYDGGGMAMGTAAPATAATSGMSTSSGMLETSGMSGMCGSGSSSIASSSTPSSTSPTTLGGAARTGIPLGSTEIGNLGISSAAAIPTIGVQPTTSSLGISAAPTMPVVAAPLAPSSTTTGSTVPGLTSTTTSPAIIPGG